MSCFTVKQVVSCARCFTVKQVLKRVSRAGGVFLDLLFGDDRHLLGVAGRRLLNRLLTCFTLSYLTVKQMLPGIGRFTVKQVLYG